MRPSLALLTLLSLSLLYVSVVLTFSSLHLVYILESINETCTTTFGGVSVRYAYLSQRGYYPDGEFKYTMLQF